MPGTDSFQQGLPYPRLSDAPNAESAGSSLVNAIAPKANMRFSDASARNAAIPSPVAGMECWLVAEGRKEIYSGTAWQAHEPTGTWSTFVPSWTARAGTGVQPTLGNGSLTSRWTRTGRLVTWFGRLAYGSLSTPGNGLWYMSLPTPAAANGLDIVGTASYVAPGLNNFTGISLLGTGDTAVGFVTSLLGTDYTNNLTHAGPTTHVAGNLLLWSLSYESAA
ncbi:hypothetical protein ATKI12_6974 [Kitasatospora sp. Ki12]